MLVLSASVEHQGCCHGGHAKHQDLRDVVAFGLINCGKNAPKSTSAFGLLISTAKPCQKKLPRRADCESWPGRWTNAALSSQARRDRRPRQAARRRIASPWPQSASPLERYPDHRAHITAQVFRNAGRYKIACTHRNDQSCHEQHDRHRQCDHSAAHRVKPKRTGADNGYCRQRPNCGSKVTVRALPSRASMCRPPMPCCFRSWRTRPFSSDT
jgi:hypothetical protein